jgi:hypothetical protein
MIRMIFYASCLAPNRHHSARGSVSTCQGGCCRTGKWGFGYYSQWHQPHNADCFQHWSWNPAVSPYNFNGVFLSGDHGHFVGLGWNLTATCWIAQPLCCRKGRTHFNRGSKPGLPSNICICLQSLSFMHERIRMLLTQPLNSYPKIFSYIFPLRYLAVHHVHWNFSNTSLDCEKACEMLENIHQHLCMQSHLYEHKDKNVTGQHVNTWLRNLINQTQGKVNASVATYTWAHNALVKLSGPLGEVGWWERLLSLKAEDIHPLKDGEDGDLGGNKLSWI